MKPATGIPLEVAGLHDATVLGASPRRSRAWGTELLVGELLRIGNPPTLGLTGLHSARRGDYQVIDRIDEDGHRSEPGLISARAYAG